ncbi:O-antigen ligase family protein [Arthrobacter sp. W4I7]|uniref:O-antigen ligase family protein n=1 Tax=Arthrobacter sp. W4I7 TaxID=3042296 RepID=UPI00277F1B85|nr:O-antigen ligase family protein [Arthrobacter sp. W4I7]MDQ0689850.1 O-antigen ligase [Arthrobacter sp. W4I7]
MTLLLLVGGLTVFLLLSLQASKYPQIVLYAFTAITAAAWDWPILPAVGSVGGASIFPEDAVAGVMLLTLAFRPQRFWSAVRPYLPIVLVTVIAVAASLTWGVAIYGAGGLNEFRSFLYPLAAVAWALNQDWASDAWQASMRCWAIATGLMLSLVAAAHIALYGLGKADGFVQSAFSGSMQTARPLTAGQAILVALCGVYLLHGLGSKTRKGLGWAALFIGVTLVAQHRSVWIALAAALLVLFLKVRGAARARLVLAAVTVAFAVAILALSQTFNPLSNEFAEKAGGTKTYNDREQGWTALIGQNLEEGMGPTVFGSPFGTGWKRIENGVYVEWAPHNWYVTVYLRLGLFGILVFACLLAAVLWRLLRTRDVGTAAAAFALMLAYCWAYSLPYQIAPFFAWAMWSASKREARQVEEIPPLPAALPIWVKPSSASTPYATHR